MMCNYYFVLCYFGNRVLTPECCTQDLRVESLLVFADLWRIALRASVDRVNVDHRALPRRVGP